ncbi:hypothetical protein D3C80_1473800 [compost metagenome]
MAASISFFSLMSYLARRLSTPYMMFGSFGERPPLKYTSVTGPKSTVSVLPVARSTLKKP